VPRRAAEVRIGLSEEIAFARTRPMGGIPVASPTFAAISAVALASPGSEVCKQRRYPVATMPFPAVIGSLAFRTGAKGHHCKNSKLTLPACGRNL
jgi:hypothetical protein